MTDRPSTACAPRSILRMFAVGYANGASLFALVLLLNKWRIHDRHDALAWTLLDSIGIGAVAAGGWSVCWPTYRRRVRLAVWAALLLGLIWSVVPEVRV